MSSRLQQYRKTWYMLLYNIQANITHLEPFTMYSASNLNIAQLPEQISNVTDGKLLWFSQTISLYCRFLLVQQNKISYKDWDQSLRLYVQNYYSIAQGTSLSLCRWENGGFCLV